MPTSFCSGLLALVAALFAVTAHADLGLPDYVSVAAADHDQPGSGLIKEEPPMAN